MGGPVIHRPMVLCATLADGRKTSTNHLLLVLISICHCTVDAGLCMRFFFLNSMFVLCLLCCIMLSNLIKDILLSKWK